jgi:hypothetical protein
VHRFLPAYNRHGTDISVVHYIGASKPWDQLNRFRSRANNDDPTVYSGLLDRWFDVYERHYGHTSTANIGRHLSGRQGAPFDVPPVTAVWDALHVQDSRASYRPPSPDRLPEMLRGPHTDIMAFQTFMPTAAYNPEEEGAGAYIRLGMDTDIPILRPANPPPFLLPENALGMDFEHLPEPMQVQDLQEVRIEHAVPLPEPEVAEVVGEIPAPHELAARVPVESGMVGAAPEVAEEEPQAQVHEAESTEPDLQVPQVHVTLDVHYANVWDQPSWQSRAFFEPPASYNPVPPFTESRYAEAMSHTESATGEPRRPVFPWEEPQAEGYEAKPPSRVFPGDVDMLPVESGMVAAAPEDEAMDGVPSDGGLAAQQPKPQPIRPVPHRPSTRRRGPSRAEILKREEERVRREGLASLKRFIEQMEQRGRQARRRGGVRPQRAAAAGAARDGPAASTSTATAATEATPEAATDASDLAPGGTATNTDAEDKLP